MIWAAGDIVPRMRAGHGVLCALQTQPREVNKSGRFLDVVDALDIEDARDALDRRDNVLELFAVAHVECDFDARAGVIVAAALKAANIRAGSTDDIGNSGDHSGAIFGEDAQAHWKLRLRGRSPFDGDAPVSLVEQILDVWTILAVNGDPASASHVADDVVTQDRVATFRAIDHQVVVAAHYDRSFVHAEHALDG